MSIAPGGLPGMPQGAGAPGMAIPPGLLGGPKPALPPSLQASDRTSGVTTPSPHMGPSANGLIMVRNAVSMLQNSLSTVPMGTEMHTAIAKAIVDLGKHLKPDDKDQGTQLGGLIQQVKQQAQQGPGNAIARLFPQSGGPQAPAMPPPSGMMGGGEE